MTVAIAENPTAIRGVRQDEIVKKAVKVGSFESERDRWSAVRGILSDDVIAIQVLGACGILGNGASERAVDKATRVKGRHKVRAAMMHTRSLRQLDLVDTVLVHESIRDRFADRPYELEEAVGIRAHLRYFVKLDQVGSIPWAMVELDSATGRHTFQNLDPTGHPIADLIDLLREYGVQYPFVTSLNKSDEPTLRSLAEGIEFSRENGISFILTDNQLDQKPAAFPIIHAADLTVIRASRDPSEVLTRLQGE